eukprot:scaffold82638_cov24-Phaeocystis_antarctica.AAC.1
MRTPGAGLLRAGCPGPGPPGPQPSKAGRRGGGGGACARAQAAPGVELGHDLRADPTLALALTRT